MELTNDKAQEDFEIIKNAIEQGDGKKNDMSGLLLRYGLVQLVLFILSEIMFVFAVKQMNSSWSLIVILFLKIVIYVYITTFYFKVYRTVHMSSNKYFLGFLVTFGVIAIVYPYIEILINVVSFLANLSMESGIRLSKYNSLLNIILFCVCLIVCSFITNKKVFIVIAILILTLYIMIDIFNYYLYFKEIGIVASAVLKTVCTTFGYIALSFVMKRRKNNGY